MDHFTLFAWAREGRALAASASSWIYKLSGIQRSGEKIMLPQESEMCHLPRVRNRKERRGQVSQGLDFTPHVQGSCGTRSADLHRHSGAQVSIFFCVWIQRLLFSSDFSPSPRHLQIRMTGRRRQSYFHFHFLFAIYIFKINACPSDSVI